MSVLVLLIAWNGLTLSTFAPAWHKNLSGTLFDSPKTIRKPRFAPFLKTTYVQFFKQTIRRKQV